MKRLIVMAVLVASGCAPVRLVETGPESTPIPQRCDAAAARSLIGSHVGAVSFPAGANVRIVCTTCPTTRDLRPDRLNVRFNQTSGIIENVDCG
jgi:hypothetical protein